MNRSINMTLPFGAAMRKSLQALAVLFTGGLLLTSCGDPVKLDVDIKDFDKLSGRVAISAIIDNKATPDTVFVRRLSSVYQTTPGAGLAATVTIADNRGNTYTLNPVAGMEGAYITPADFALVLDDRLYTLTVETAGQTFTSTSAVGRIYNIKTDSLTTFYRKEEGFYREGHYVKFYGEIETARQAYFLFKFYSNDSLLNRARGDEGVLIATGDNRQINGKIMGLELPNAYVKGAEAKIEVYGLTFEAYRYWGDISKQTYNDGGMFSNPPANIKGNISNGGLGFFQVSEVYADSTIIQ